MPKSEDKQVASLAFVQAPQWSFPKKCIRVGHRSNWLTISTRFPMCWGKILARVDLRRLASLVARELTRLESRESCQTLIKNIALFRTFSRCDFHGLTDQNYIFYANGQHLRQALSKLRHDHFKFLSWVLWKIVSEAPQKPQLHPRRSLHKWKLRARFTSTMPKSSSIYSRIYWFSCIFLFIHVSLKMCIRKKRTFAITKN